MIQSNNKISRHITATGRVQGVGFRHFTRQTARELNISGWVRNLKDGRVEAVVQGEPSRVEEMIQRFGQGPPAARVDDLEVREPDEHKVEVFGSFTVKRTV